MSKLSRLDIQKIEDYWMNHESNKRKLKFREWELLNPHNEEEMRVNVKSSRISNPTQNKAFVLAEDKEYQNLQNIIQAIDSIYKDLDHDLKTIVDMRYWDKENNCYEWEDIADYLYMSRNKVLRKRNVLIDLTADKIGYV